MVFITLILFSLYLNVFGLTNAAPLFETTDSKRSANDESRDPFKGIIEHFTNYVNRGKPDSSNEVRLDCAEDEPVAAASEADQIVQRDDEDAEDDFKLLLNKERLEAIETDVFAEESEQTESPDSTRLRRNVKIRRPSRIKNVHHKADFRRDTAHKHPHIRADVITFPTSEAFDSQRQVTDFKVSRITDTIPRTNMKSVRSPIRIKNPHHRADIVGLPKSKSDRVKRDHRRMQGIEDTESGTADFEVSSNIDTIPRTDMESSVRSPRWIKNPHHRADIVGLPKIKSGRVKRDHRQMQGIEETGSGTSDFEVSSIIDTIPRTDMESSVRSPRRIKNPHHRADIVGLPKSKSDRVKRDHRRMQGIEETGSGSAEINSRRIKRRSPVSHLHPVDNIKRLTKRHASATTYENNITEKLDDTVLQSVANHTNEIVTTEERSMSNGEARAPSLPFLPGGSSSTSKPESQKEEGNSLFPSIPGLPNAGNLLPDGSSSGNTAPTAILGGFSIIIVPMPGLSLSNIGNAIQTGQQFSQLLPGASQLPAIPG